MNIQPSGLKPKKKTMTDEKISTEATFTRVRTKFLHGQKLTRFHFALHGTGGTERIFERLSVQVWDLKKQVPNLHT